MGEEGKRGGKVFDEVAKKLRGEFTALNSPDGRR
jgi:hypothetical protein